MDRKQRHRKQHHRKQRHIWVAAPSLIRRPILLPRTEAGAGPSARCAAPRVGIRFHATVRSLWCCLSSLHSHDRGPRDSYYTPPHPTLASHLTPPGPLLVAGEPFVVADFPAVWELVRSDVECRSGDSNLGTFGSVQACASLTHTLQRSLSFLRALARSPSLLSALCPAVTSRAAVTVCRLAPMPPTRELGTAAVCLLSTARAPSRAGVIR